MRSIVVERNSFRSERIEIRSTLAAAPGRVTFLGLPDSLRFLDEHVLHVLPHRNFISTYRSIEFHEFPVTPNPGRCLRMVRRNGDEKLVASKREGEVYRSQRLAKNAKWSVPLFG